MSRKIVFKPQKDNPVSKDSFEGGGHTRCANALVDSIRNFRDDNRAIGLEGGWGAGKSSVVKMAEDKLKDEKYYFFTYDLWTNKNTEFRRGFLESFNNWLFETNKNLLNEKKHKEFEDRINSRSKEITSTHHLEYTQFGILFIILGPILAFLALWLSPFGASLRYTVWNLESSNKSGAPTIPWIFNFLFNYGHCLAFGIIIILVLSFIYEWCKRSKRKESDNQKEIGFEKAFKQSFSLFDRKSDVDVVTQSIREKDPTQNEFQRLLDDILETVQKDEKRIIFVLDNIDRLPSKDAITQAWSDVRAIADPQKTGKILPRHSVTTIIPYDRKHILNAVDYKTISYEHDDIFRKSFDMVFTVAPPLASNLEAYLQDKFGTALDGDLDKGQLYRLYQIYENFITAEQVIPTPRQVLAYVNEVGNLFAQWEGAISPEAAAIFVLYKLQIQEDPKKARTPDKVVAASVLRCANQADISEQLLAIAYNIEKDLVLELTLDRDILRLIRAEDSTDFIELSNTAGFKVQISELLFKELPNIANEDIDEFCNVLSNWLAADIEPAVRKNAEKAFMSAINEIDINLDTSKESKELYKKLTKITDVFEEDKVSDVVVKFAKKMATFITDDKEKISLSDGRNWIAAIGPILNKIRESDDFSNIISKLFIPSNPLIHLGVALDVDEYNLRYYGFKKLDYLPKSFESHLLENISSGSVYFKYQWEQLKYKYTKSEHILPLFEATCQRLESGKLEADNDNPKNTIMALFLLWAKGRHHQAIKDRAEALFQSGAFWWHLDEALNDETADSIGYGFAFLMDWLNNSTDFPNYTGQPNHPTFGNIGTQQNRIQAIINGSGEFTYVNRVLEIVSKNNFVDEWIEYSSNQDLSSLISVIVKSKLSDDGYKYKNILLVIEYFDHLKKLLGDDFESFMNRLGENADATGLDKVDVSVFSQQQILDMKQFKGDAWNKLLLKAAERLKELKSEDWVQAFNGGNSDFKQLWVLTDEVKNLSSSVIKEPLKNRFVSFLTSEDTDLAKLPVESRLVDLMPMQSRKALYKEVLNSLSTSNTTSLGIQSIQIMYPEFYRLTEFSINSTAAIQSFLNKLILDNIIKAQEIVKLNEAEWHKVGDAASKEDLQLIIESLPYHSDREESEQNAVSYIYSTLSIAVPEKPSNISDDEALDNGKE